MKKITFPEGFIWGTANSAYQSEGAWNVDGKGESIWDRYNHIPGNVLDGGGDVACDFYHRYKEDLALVKELGITHYRTSIAWTRIIPDGMGEVNPKGIQFYHDVLDEMIRLGIEPTMTLYLWDLPQKLQDIGGWANPATADYFERYARILFQEFGSKVKTWITFEEPFCVAFIGNYLGTYAPALKDFSTALKVSYNILLAHGKAVRACHELVPDAKIGISLNLSDCKSATDKPEDVQAAIRADGYRNRWFLDPLFKGNFPAEMLEWYRDRGVILPEIRQADLEIMSTPMDFLGLNYYSPHNFVNAPSVWPIEVSSVKVGWPVNDINWEIVPEALYNILMRIKKDYGDVEIMIAANGSCQSDLVNREHKILDDARIDYMHDHLLQLRRAIDDGSPVKSYYAFCFTDNLEWAIGFTKRFGLVYVDFNTQERIVKESGKWYGQVARENGFMAVCD